MGTDEWDALAWWEQLTYFEGFEEEGIVESSNGSSDPTTTNERVHQTEGGTIIERDHHQTFSGVPGEMAAFGFTEHTI